MHVLAWHAVLILAVSVAYGPQRGHGGHDQRCPIRARPSLNQGFSLKTLETDHLTLTSHACFALACRPDTGCECCFGFRVDIRAAAPRQCTCSGGCGAAAHLSLGPAPRPEPHAMYLKSGQHGSRSTSLLRFRREHSLLLSTRHCAVCRVEGPTRGACSLSNLDPV